MNNTAVGSFFLALAILGAVFWLGVTGQAVTGSGAPLLGMLSPAAVVVLALGGAGLFFLTRKRRR